MSTDSVTYAETNETSAYMDRFSPDHLRRLAIEQAEENANDPEHVAKVNSILERYRRGERRELDVQDHLRGA